MAIYPTGNWEIVVLLPVTAAVNISVYQYSPHTKFLVKYWINILDGRIEVSHFKSEVRFFTTAPIEALVCLTHERTVDKTELKVPKK